MNAATTQDHRFAPDETAPTAPAKARRPLWQRVVVGVAGTGAGLTMLAGVLHMPFAAPLLRKISPASVCPVMRGTPEQIDRGHALGAAAIRASATTTAPARPALGFALDQSRMSDMTAWAQKHGVKCSANAGNQNLQQCANVPAEAVGQPAETGPLEEVSFEFRSSGEVVTIQTLRRGLGAEQAATLVGKLEETLASALGPPTTVGGAPTSAHLSRGPLSSYVAEHTFKDYQASVSATNLQKTGIMVRESYISAR